MDSGGDDGVLEIVGVAIVPTAKIKPGLRVLMNEERSERADILDAVVFKCNPFPGVPGFGGQRMSGGSESQQVHHHHLAVVVPTELKEARFRRPSMGQEARVLRKPRPIHAAENQAREFADLRMLEMLAARQDSAKQNSGVD